MHRLFPLSFNLKNGSSLLKSVIIYVVVSVVSGWIGSLLGGIALIGWIVGIAAWLIQIYCVIGLVLAVLSYFRIIK